MKRSKFIQKASIAYASHLNPTLWDHQQVVWQAEALWEAVSKTLEGKPTPDTQLERIEMLECLLADALYYMSEDVTLVDGNLGAWRDKVEAVLGDD